MKTKETTTATTNHQVKGITLIDLKKIQQSNFNPRKQMEETELQELADSIREQGVIQPIVVRAKDEKFFEIVCGERRYRASILAKQKTVPAIVKDLSDDEALEIAITENLQRRDISPVEEANAYQQLIEVKQYEVPALAVRFGKSEKYIYQRLKLTSLINEIMLLLEQEEISLGIALEIAQYKPDVQKEIYEEHLEDEDNYWNWRHLKIHEFSEKVQQKYTMNLDAYHFDTVPCRQCFSNSNNMLLFQDESTQGFCTNKTCLQAKNRKYLLETCLKLIKEDPQQEFCIEPYLSNADSWLLEQLEKKGYKIITEQHHYPYPENPKLPFREDFEDEESYHRHNEQFEAKLDKYQKQQEEFLKWEKEGRIKKLLGIRDKDVIACFTMLSAKELPAGDGQACLLKLEQQDNRNKEISVEKMVEDAKRLIKEKDLMQCNFSDLEEKLVYFALLPEVRKEYFSLFGIEEKYYLNEEDKFNIINNLTDKQMAFIKREFILSKLTQTFKMCPQSDLLLAWVRQHYPDELSAIENQYQEVYNKRHERIEEKKAALKINKEV